MEDLSGVIYFCIWSAMHFSFSITYCKETSLIKADSCLCLRIEAQIFWQIRWHFVSLAICNSPQTDACIFLSYPIKCDNKTFLLETLHILVAKYIEIKLKLSWKLYYYYLSFKKSKCTERLLRSEGEMALIVLFSCATYECQ